ncbi:MAG TPA: hypothetical protein VK110_09815 [Salinisphaeraceae bacterium]|nr:hypothetical protein [Salinisphaeraceae bacterium]
MATIRKYMVSFSFSVVAMLALISFVFLGSSLTHELSGLATYAVALCTATAVAVALAVPMISIGKSRELELEGDEHTA